MALFTELDQTPVTVIAKHYDSAAVTYDSGYSSPLNKAEDQRVVQLLEGVIQGNVVDVGCGTGLVLDYFSAQLEPSHYIGFDVSTQMLMKAKHKYSKYTFLQADMSKIPLPSASQDALVSTFGPLSYSLFPEKTLVEYLRVLKPGGWLAVMPYSLRVGCGLGVEGYSTATEQSVPKKYYTTELLTELFAPCKNVQLHGINYVGNFIETMSVAMPVTPLSVSEYIALLTLDRQLAEILPVEYARHIMVVAQKAGDDD